MARDTGFDSLTEPHKGAFVAENPPSEFRADDPTFARFLGMSGLGLIFVGAAVLFFNRMYGPRILPPAWGQVFVVFGLASLLFHAASDRDPQIRRSYGVFGFALTVLGALVSILPVMTGSQSLFLPWGALGLFLGLLFIIQFSRLEDESNWRKFSRMLLGVGAVALAGTGFLGGNISTDFLLNPGLLVVLLGLGYFWAAVGDWGPGSTEGFRISRIIGLVGLAVIAVAAFRSMVAGGKFFLPGGLLLIIAGLLYLAVSVGLASDSRLVALIKRELAAYFYSPIAYLVLFGFTLFAWFGYLNLVGELLSDLPGMPAPTIPEPIVQSYVVNLIPVFGVMFLVPALTMRLLSDEKKTGTLEVLLTAPVDEVSVVVSKFLAGLIFYLFNWLPFGLFLIALRVEGGTPFDYRPLLSFFVVLVSTGAAFIAMGLFFSSLTKNQIIAAVLTFAGMIALLAFYLFRNYVGPTWGTIFQQVNFVSQWIDSLGGKLYLRGVILQISMAVFWLFLTVKVLESRRWS